MTIYQLKRLNKANGGLFFDRENMVASGATLKDLKLWKHPKTGHYQLYNRSCTGWEHWFHRDTGRVITPAQGKGLPHSGNPPVGGLTTVTVVVD